MGSRSLGGSRSVGPVAGLGALLIRPPLFQREILTWAKL